jgi:hypothetical protein
MVQWIYLTVLLNSHVIMEPQLVIPINNDHCYCADPVTPRKEALKTKLQFTYRHLAFSRKKLKNVMPSKRRLITRNSILQDVIAELRKLNLIGVDSLGILEK